MSTAQLEAILDACKSVPYLLVGGFAPRSPQERANDAWCALGREMGFDAMTVTPVAGKQNTFFTAVAVERNATVSQGGEVDKKATKSKRDRFLELAPKRVDRALVALAAVAKCGALAGYEYTDAEVDKIFDALQGALLATRGKFVKSDERAQPKLKPEREAFAL